MSNRIKYVLELTQAETDRVRHLTNSIYAPKGTPKANIYWAIHGTGHEYRDFGGDNDTYILELTQEEAEWLMVNTGDNGVAKALAEVLL